MLPQCRDMGVGVVPWSPLARGRLARGVDGPHTTRAASDELARTLYDDADDAIVAAVGEVADRHGVSRAQVALAWLHAQDGVTAPIVGATRLAHLEDAIASVDVELTDDDLAALTAPYRPRPVLGHS